MAKQGKIGDRLRERLRTEREHRDWSQNDLAKLLQHNGLPYMIASMVAKIEAGDRSVRAEELNILADLFGASTDVLLGRGSRTTDLAWAVSKLTSTAQKMATEVNGLRQRLYAEIDDVYYTVGKSSAADNLLIEGDDALKYLATARDQLLRLAAQFPLPTGFGPTARGEEDSRAEET